MKEKVYEILGIIASLIIPIILLGSISSCLSVETTHCDTCGDSFPEEYAVYDFHYNYICPSCMNKKMKGIGSGDYIFCGICREYKRLDYANGMWLCESCGDDLSSECVNCGDLAFTLYPYSDFEYCLCNGCMKWVMEDPSAISAIMNTFEKEYLFP